MPEKPNKARHELLPAALVLKRLSHAECAASELTPNELHEAIGVTGRFEAAGVAAPCHSA